MKHHHQHESEPRPPAADSAKPQAASDCAKPQAADELAKERNAVECMDELLANVQKLQAELAASKDRELRAHAELDNFRKRAARELDDRLRYANLPLLRDLLPVIDNLDRAMEAAEKNADLGALLEGVKMATQQFDDVFKRFHCTRIDALHQPFDPNVHHAVMQQPSEEHPANTVLLVTQNGYQLHDRVVRPSQVIVSTSQGQQENK